MLNAEYNGSLSSLTPLELLQWRDALAKAEEADMGIPPMVNYAEDIAKINVELISRGRCLVCGVYKGDTAIVASEHRCMVLINHGHRLG